MHPFLSPAANPVSPGAAGPGAASVAGPLLPSPGQPDRPGSGSWPGSGRPAPRHGGQAWILAWALALGACSTGLDLAPDAGGAGAGAGAGNGVEVREARPQPVPPAGAVRPAPASAARPDGAPGRPGATASGPVAAPAAADLPPGTAAPPSRDDSPAAPARLERERSVWVAARWDELPGWSADRVHEAWPALLAGCQRPAPGWADTCARARAEPPVRGPEDEARVRQWLQTQLQPYRVEARQTPSGGDPALGLITGYFEPSLVGRRQPDARHGVALHRPPPGLGQRKPWYSRAEMARLPAAQAALKGQEIAWLADPLDLLLVQIQGSGRLSLLDEPGPDGRPRTVRLAYAAHNDQAYASVGKWLVERGAFTLEQASWPAIRAWARAHPQRVPEMLAANPRVVFFREEPLPDPQLGPLGAQGVPLTPGRSLAVDKSSVPYGTPVWVATTQPQAWQPEPPPPRPLERLMLAQDTGSAIVGAVRADYFWGWEPGAEEQAGRMKQPLRLWALWPRSAAAP